MYQVHVIETLSGEIVKTLPANNLRKAEKLERGLSINLDHDKFHTSIG